MTPLKFDKIGGTKEKMKRQAEDFHAYNLERVDKPLEAIIMSKP
jgi:hypothetical protein